MIRYRAKKKTRSLYFALALTLLSGVGAFYVGMAYTPRPKVVLSNTVRPPAYPAFFQPSPTEIPSSTLPPAAISTPPATKVDKEEMAMNLPPLPKYGMDALGQKGAWAGDETSAKSESQLRDHKGNLCVPHVNVDKIPTVTLHTMLPPKGVVDSCSYRRVLSFRADITPSDFFSDEMSDAQFASSFELSRFYRGGKWSINDFEKLANLETYSSSAALPLYLILKQANSPAAQLLLERKDTVIPEEIKQFLETGKCFYGDGPLCLEGQGIQN